MVEERIISQRLFENFKEKMEVEYDSVSVEKISVMKNNGVKLDGAVVHQEGEVISPTIYFEAYADEIAEGSLSVEQATNRMMEAYEYGMLEQPVLPELNRENAQKNLYAVIVNSAQNKEILEEVPHREIEDLSVIARYGVAENASFLVKSSMCGILGMEPSEILEYAERNSRNKEYSVKSMEEVLAGFMGDDIPTEIMDEIVAEQNAAIPMYVITNQEMSQGAIGVFINEDVRKEIFDKIGGEYYLLPSSVHECIAIPAEGLDENMLQNMVYDVNLTQVDIQDRLSDNVYHISSNLKLEIAGAKEQRMEEHSMHEKISERISRKR